MCEKFFLINFLFCDPGSSPQVSTAHQTACTTLRQIFWFLESLANKKQEGCIVRVTQ